MFADAIRTLYGYNAWANDRVLDAAAGLSSGEMTDPGGAGLGPVRDTLVHVLGAQWLYLERWRGTSPRSLPAPDETPDLPALRTRWDAVERDTQAFVAALQDDDLARVVPYVNLRGERWAYPLWQQLVQQVNHATQHRSEAAARLTQLGRSPGDLDFLIYIDLHPGG